MSSPLVIPVPAHSALQDLPASLAGQRADTLRDAELIAFRTPRGFVESFSQESWIAGCHELTRRSQGRPVYVVATKSPRPAELCVFQVLDTVLEPATTEVLRAVRASDLRRLIQTADSGCHLASGRAFHFRTPSGV